MPAPIPARRLAFDPAGGLWLASAARLVHNAPAGACDDRPPSVRVSRAAASRRCAAASASRVREPSFVTASAFYEYGPDIPTEVGRDLATVAAARRHRHLPPARPRAASLRAGARARRSAGDQLLRVRHRPRGQRRASSIAADDGRVRAPSGRRARARRRRSSGRRCGRRAGSRPAAASSALATASRARDLLGVVGAAALEPLAQRLLRRRRDEDPDRVGHRALDLARALHLDLEHDRRAAAGALRELRAQRAVAAAGVLGVLEEVALDDAAVELRVVEEVVVARRPLRRCAACASWPTPRARAPERARAVRGSACPCRRRKGL